MDFGGSRQQLPATNRDHSIETSRLIAPKSAAKNPAASPSAFEFIPCPPSACTRGVSLESGDAETDEANGDSACSPADRSATQCSDDEACGDEGADNRDGWTAAADVAKRKPTSHIATKKQNAAPS